MHSILYFRAQECSKERKIVKKTQQTKTQNGKYVKQFAVVEKLSRHRRKKVKRQ